LRIDALLCVLPFRATAATTTPRSAYVLFVEAGLASPPAVAVSASLRRWSWLAAVRRRVALAFGVAKVTQPAAHYGRGSSGPVSTLWRSAPRLRDYYDVLDASSLRFVPLPHVARAVAAWLFPALHVGAASRIGERLGLSSGRQRPNLMPAAWTGLMGPGRLGRIRRYQARVEEGLPHLLRFGGGPYCGPE